MRVISAQSGLCWNSWIPLDSVRIPDIGSVKSGRFPGHHISLGSKGKDSRVRVCVKPVLSDKQVGSGGECAAAVLAVSGTSGGPLVLPSHHPFHVACGNGDGRAGIHQDPSKCCMCLVHAPRAQPAASCVMSLCVQGTDPSIPNPYGWNLCPLNCCAPHRASVLLPLFLTWNLQTKGEAQILCHSLIPISPSNASIQPAAPFGMCWNVSTALGGLTL